MRQISVKDQPMRSVEPSAVTRVRRDAGTTLTVPPVAEEHARPLGASASGEAQPPFLRRVLRVPLTLLIRLGVPPLLVALDGLAVVIGVVGMEVVSRLVSLDAPARKTAAFGAVLLLVFWQAGLHRSRLTLSVLDDLPTLLGRWLAAAALAVLGQIAWSQAIWQDYVINWAFLWGAVTVGVAAVVLRAVGYAAIRRLRSRGVVQHRTVVVGAGRVGAQVTEILQAHPEYGLHPIGFLDDDPPDFDNILPLPVLGGPQSLTDVLLERRVNNVVVAFSSMKESEMVSVIRTCDRFSCELFVVPRLFELSHVDTAMDAAWGFPLVRLRRATYRSPAWRVKRLVDVLVSGLAVLAIAPLLLVLAVAVRLDGGPGILFRQERVGVDGRRFDVLKFRSLRPATDTESATRWNVADDERMSALGRFLRKSSLDELPQLYNILRGDMSLVGPRPERPYFVDQFRGLYPSYEARHRVPSGLTGWAQVHGLRGDTSIADRARFDNYYIENWSPWLDVKIVLRTVSSILRGAGR
jgi:exopolysaccharide biosynthesis polyprenyl glycosylphosphotransferase